MPEVSTVGTSPKSTARQLLEQQRWWRNANIKNLLGTAAAWLREQAETIDDLHQRLAKQERTFLKEKEKLATDAEKRTRDILIRTKVAISEMVKVKKAAKEEKPFAIVISPYQYAEMTLHGHFKQPKLFGVPVYVARGVYGPLVLTETAFNAFSRNAPELALIRKQPSNSSNW